MQDYLLVALGGALGACARFGVVVWFEDRNYQFPFATLLVNLIGCFLMGFLFGIGWMTPRDPRRMFMGVGFLGSLTTFSAFGHESWLMIEQGRWFGVSANVAISLLGGLCVLALGVWLGRILTGPSSLEPNRI